MRPTNTAPWKRAFLPIVSDAAVRTLLTQLKSDKQLTQLERIPLIPPINLGLTILAWTIFLSSIAAAAVDWFPLYVSIPVSALAIYSSFTPLHDATHRAVSSSPWLNDLIGTIAACLLVPCLSTSVYRVLHLEHHRWAGDRQRDPDTPLVHIRMPWLLLALAAPDLVWAWWWATKLWRQRTVKERLAFFLSIGAHLSW